MSDKWKKAQEHEMKYYNSGKNKQWKTPHSLEYWKKFLYIKKIEGFGVELGCGPNGLYNFTNKVLGIDSIDYGKKNFVQGRAEKIPIDKRVDFVICCNSIDHFQDIDVTMKEILRITDKIVLWTNIFPSIVSKIFGIFDKMHPYHLTIKQVEELIIKYKLIINFYKMESLYSVHGKYASKIAKIKLFIASCFGIKGLCLHLEVRK